MSKCSCHDVKGGTVGNALVQPLDCRVSLGAGNVLCCDGMGECNLPLHIAKSYLVVKKMGNRSKKSIL